jgi:hypothetical protein
MEKFPVIVDLPSKNGGFSILLWVNYNISLT